MKRAALLALWASLWLAHPAPTPACSVTAGYLRPSNFELVRDTEAIVLAKAVRTVSENDRVTGIVFEVAQVLKGTVDEKVLTLPGHDTWFGASDPADFSRARPGAGKGACIAFDYKLNASFVLFLGRQGRQWRVQGPPFTRVNEEVSGPEAPWTKAVVLYARIAGLATLELQKADLKRLETVGGAPDGMAQDIDRHFHHPHGSKSFADLKELYDHAGTDEVRSGVLWAFANGKHPEARALIQGLIKSGDLTRYAEPISEYVSNLRDATVVEPLLKALAPDMHVLQPNDRWAVLWAVSRAGDRSHSSGMLSLLKSVAGEEARPLMDYFIRHPTPDSIAEIDRRIAKDYGRETWLTFSVSAMGDPKVLSWALEARKTPGEHRWIAVYALAISPLVEADRASQEILKGQDLEAIEWLAQGYGQSRSPQRVKRLLETFEFRSRIRHQALWVRRALEELAEQGDREAQEALKKLPEPPEEDN